ncbi:HAD-IIB family hydrolase [Cryptosporangium aurantiacum]|uniref:AAA+ ATPase domain-containing protein n=1 Tax=Cryptosporangium aurantiacum TaxID=134849 RepID=A0A1M7TUK3_9ACTN|nr:HAD-IIB family hydrolase [Cryptosporangium aurantiacum]SHN74414.1 hypothetical protein SAMN05443668_10776 [Cryptosporangium aurantiacum]
MRYRALAFDYDGTLAHDGAVPESTVDALRRAADSKRALILVTGRELDDLQRVFDHLDLFDRVVAENGGLLYRPDSREHQPLSDPPPEALVERLRAADIQPLGVGAVIIATRQPHDDVVQDAIRDLGLEYQLIYNKGAVMVLPPGVNKASGLRAALDELGLSGHEALAVGDAENDHAFLDVCECGVAVANAVDSLKERCDVVTEGARGAGVEEIIDRVIENDLEDLPGGWGGAGPVRHHILLGRSEEAGPDEAGPDDDDGEVRLAPYGVRAMIAGPSGGGKSTVTSAFLERLLAAGYQACLVDPEGDYDSGIGKDSVVIGDPQREPTAREIHGLLERPGQSTVLNLLAVPIADRPAYFTGLLPRLLEPVARHSRPHWLVIDEAHHQLPPNTATDNATLLRRFSSTLLVTVHPESVDPAVVGLLNTVIGVGPEGHTVFEPVAEALEVDPPRLPADGLEPGQLLIWRVGEDEARLVELEPGTIDRERHRRKYALGTMSADTSFWFRGPEQKLNLRAHNLMLFLEIGQGVDEDTWLYHLRRGDYSKWISGTLDDDELATEIETVEKDESLDAAASRDRVRDLVTAKYTQAAEPDPEGGA